MGLNELIANKKLRTQINDLYHRIHDSYTDITDRVVENKLTKPAAVDMLIVVKDEGKQDYATLKSNNQQSERLFIESDKKFTPLFQNIEEAIEEYNTDLTIVK